MSEWIDVVFDGPPMAGGKFVEVEDGAGRSVNAGQWVEREDGHTVLRLHMDCHALQERLRAAERALDTQCMVSARLRAQLEGTGE